MLVEKGADINLVDRYREAPLYGAASNGCVKATRVLVEAGANINLAEKDGYKGVHPSLSAKLTFAPASTSTLTASSQPSQAALNNK